MGTDGKNGGRYNLAKLISVIKKVWNHTYTSEDKFIVLTGGEPLLQVDDLLVEKLKKENFFIAVETNGTIKSDLKFDWVTVSPKENAEWNLRKGDELKVVYPQHKFDLKKIINLDFKFIKSCLGRNWALTGIVQKGDQNGRKLGFATANIHLLKTLEPKFGVYFTRSRIMNHDGSDFTSTHMPSITNFGIRPTLDGQKKLFETHILNYEEYFKNNEIYDKRIHVEVLDFLRDEKKFNSFEELKDQILKDVKKAKLFHENK